MTEVTKKNSFFKFVRKHSSLHVGDKDNIEDVLTKADQTNQNDAEEVQIRPNINQKKSKEMEDVEVRTKTNERTRKAKTFQIQRQVSSGVQYGAINELVQCPLCFNTFNDPKMLPCQHTFCLNCLNSQITDESLTCPTCTKSYTANQDFLTSLPSNLYVDSFLKLMVGSPKTNNSMMERPVTMMVSSPKEKRCCQCKSIIEIFKEHLCQHCKQDFCGICWNAHITELKLQISTLVDQLKIGSKRLVHRLENHKDHNEWLVNQINITGKEKIEEIHEKQKTLLLEANKILNEGEMSAKDLQNKLKEMENNVTDYAKKEFDNISNDNEKINSFMNFHRRTIDLLNDVMQWGETKYSFDKEGFCIEKGIEGAGDDIIDEPVIVEVKGIQNPLESVENLTRYYNSRKFVPRFVWKNISRPSCVGIAPWSENLYICSADSHNIIVLDKQKGAIIERFSNPKILCPQGLAFSQVREEIYISDKWSHCIHVLSKTGEYLRSIGTKGNKIGCLRSPEGIAIEPDGNPLLYVCDTGNDRVQVFDIDTGSFLRFIGAYIKRDQCCTQLNAPADIALTKDRIIIADSGSKRIKIYSYNGENLRDIGSQGSQKGQFQYPEALAVDPRGFILVGDSGNARVQIFDPSGQLLRVFGGKGREPGRFNWISSIRITSQLEIAVTDSKNHYITIY